MLNLIRINRSFSIFLGTQGLSNLGDSVRTVVMPLLVLQLTHSPLLIAAVAALETIPYFLLHLHIGALMDRLDRRLAMLIADVGRGALILTIPLVGYFHGPVIWVTLLLAAPLSVLSSVFDAGSATVIPSIVERNSLRHAYSLFEGAESLAWVAGPIIAGVLATFAGTANALIVDGLSFFISAGGLVLIHLERSERPDAKGRLVWTDVMEGLRFLASSPALRKMVLLWSSYGLIGYGIVTGLVYVGSRGGTVGAEMAALAVSSYALGSLGGTLLAGRIEANNIVTSIVSSLTTFALGALLIATGWQAGIVSGAFLAGAGEGFLLIVYLARRARATPDYLMARIGAITAILARIASGLSIFWMALAFGWMNGFGAFLIAGILAIILATFCVFAGRNFFREDPAISST